MTHSAMGDHEYMVRALRLASRSVGRSAPNPSVGCVLVRRGVIVGEGSTSPAGGAHAEINALAAAGAEAAGASAYVTLEPCCHTGRTGPCTEALVAAGVAHVVCAVLDPNPLVAGDGVAALRAAGITVEVGLLAERAIRLNQGFFSRMQRGRPWVRSKIAASLDGRTALANGQSQWITGKAAQRDGHRYRARAGAVLTGSGTVLADDPSLTARPSGQRAAHRQPLRAIVDGRLAIPGDARTLGLPGQVVIFTTVEASAVAASALPARTRIEQVAGERHCQLGEVLTRLATLEVNDVWVEAGAGLNGALLEAGLIDELVLYLAPQLLGDAARGMFAMAPLSALDQHTGLEIDTVRRIGSDLRIIARPMYRSARRHNDTQEV